MLSHLIKILLGFSVIMLVCMVVFRPEPFVDLDCGDFTEWKSAQDVYTTTIENGRGDAHRLDGDNDGVACEKLLYL